MNLILFHLFVDELFLWFPDLGLSLSFFTIFQVFYTFEFLLKFKKQPSF